MNAVPSDRIMLYAGDAPRHNDPRGSAAAPSPVDRYTPTLGDSGGATGRDTPALTEAQQAYIDRSLTVPCGRSYVPDSDTFGDGSRMNEGVARIAPVDGWHVVVAHGDGSRIEVANGEGGVDLLTPEEFAPLLANDPTWNGTDRVLLFSCRNGGEFMDRLYDALDGKVTIMGSEHYPRVDPNGTITNSMDIGVYDAAGGPVLLATSGGWRVREAR